MWVVSLCSIIRLPIVFSPIPHLPPPCIMAAFDPLAVGGTYPDVGSRSVVSAALNADIRALSAAKDAAEVPVKAVFESAISILVLVRVRVSALPLLPPTHQ